MHFNQLFDLIVSKIPGQQLWMQCVPVWDEDKPTEEGVGLAIQKRVTREGKTFSPVFFRVVPKDEATDESGRFLPGHHKGPEDWKVETGYENPHATLKEAIEETKRLARDLPMSPILRTEERRSAILDGVNDPEDDDDPDDGLEPPNLGPNYGESRVLRQELVWPKNHESEDPQD